MFGKLKKLRQTNNEKYDAKYASVSTLTKRTLVLLMVCMITFGLFETVSSKVMAGGQGANDGILAVNMYGLSEAVSTGTWALMQGLHTYDSYTPSPSTEYKRYLGDSSVFTPKYAIDGQRWVYHYVPGVGMKYELKTATGSTSPTSYGGSVDTYWGLAANLIGQYSGNAYTLENGDTINSPGDSNAVNEQAWEMDNILNMYTSAAGTHTENDTSKMLLRYWIFGKAVSDSGILEYRTAGSNTTSSLRPIIGYGTYFSYIMASTSNVIFKQCLNLAVQFDVVGLFEGSFSNVYLNVIKSTKFYTDFLKPAYDALKGVRAGVIGILIIGLVLSFTLFKPLSSFTAAQTMREKIIKFIVRAMTMFCGVPLLALVYHMCLTTVFTGGFSPIETPNDQVGTYNYYVDETTHAGQIKIDDNILLSETTMNAYILSTFIDMKYVFDNTFALGTGASDVTVKYKYDAKANKFNLDEGAKLSTLAYNLNGFSGTAPLDSEIFGSGASLGSTATILNNMSNYDVAQVYNSSFATVAVTDPAYRSPHDIRELLISYADGETLNSSNVEAVVADYNNQFLATLVSSVAGAEPKQIDEVKGSVAQNINRDLGAYFAVSPKFKYEDSDGILGGKKDNNTEVKLETNTSSALFAYNGIPVNVAGSSRMLYSSALALPEPTSSSGIEVTIPSGGSGGVSVAGLVPNGANITVKFNQKGALFSPLGYYNFKNTEFTDNGFIVYNPTKSTNNATTLAVYRTSLVYSDLQEIAQVIYLNAVLISFGLLGWVFGLTTLANILYEFFQMIPSLFKTLLGSIQGFMHATAVVLTIVFEMLITIILYTYSVKFIDFIIRLIGRLFGLISTSLGGSGVAESIGSIINTVACLFIAVLMLWASMLLVKFRKTIVLWFTGFIKSALTMIFKTMGFTADITQDKVGNPNGSKLAMAGAAAVGVGALAASGTLDDVVSDLSKSDLGKQVGKNMGSSMSSALGHAATGDFKGAAKAMTSGAMKDTAFANASLPDQLDPTKDLSAGSQQADEALSNSADDVNAAAADDVNAGADGAAGEDAELTEALDNATAPVDGADGADGSTEGAAESGESKGWFTKTSSSDTRTSSDTSTSTLPEGRIADTNDNYVSSAAANGKNSAYQGEGKASDVNALAMDSTQTQHLSDMIASGASEAEISSYIADCQAQNFGSVENANAWVAAKQAQGDKNVSAPVSFTNAKGDTVSISTGNQAYNNNGTLAPVNGKISTNASGISTVSMSTTSATTGQVTNTSYQTGLFGGGARAASQGNQGGNKKDDLGGMTYNPSATASYQASYGNASTGMITNGGNQGYVDANGDAHSVNNWGYDAYTQAYEAVGYTADDYSGGHAWNRASSDNMSSYNNDQSFMSQGNAFVDAVESYFSVDDGSATADTNTGADYDARIYDAEMNKQLDDILK